LYFLMNSRDCFTNLWRLSGWDASWEYFSEPSFQPRNKLKISWWYYLVVSTMPEKKLFRKALQPAIHNFKFEFKFKKKLTSNSEKNFQMWIVFLVGCQSLVATLSSLIFQVLPSIWN
jgi:hypothetical protein